MIFSSLRRSAYTLEHEKFFQRTQRTLRRIMLIPIGSSGADVALRTLKYFNVHPDFVKTIAISSDPDNSINNN